MFEQGIHIQLRHASQADATGRPRVYLDVGPIYPIAVSGKTLIAGYSGRGQAVELIWQKRGILGLRASLGMLIDPSELLDASPNRSTFETGGALRRRCRSTRKWADPDLGLGASTRIGAGVDHEKGGALLDDLRSLNEKRDLDEAAIVSSSDDSNGSVSEESRLRAGNFCARLLSALKADRNIYRNFLCR